jgi:hypothetical protein
VAFELRPQEHWQSQWHTENDQSPSESRTVEVGWVETQQFVSIWAMRRDFSGESDSTLAQTLAQIVLTLGILAFCGFAVGMRPGRQARATRGVFLSLTSFTAMFLFVTWVLLSEGSPARLEAWGFDELDLIGVYVILGLTTLVGVFLLTPLWGYAIGRSVARRRAKRTHK